MRATWARQTTSMPVPCPSRSASAERSTRVAADMPSSPPQTTAEAQTVPARKLPVAYQRSGSWVRPV
ncbi:hypothetical protein C8054_11200 [Micromonospora sp. RP3T]|nr:hypothetical protein C8054_11200 [Micromonospora sp. RP3T]